MKKGVPSEVTATCPECYGHKFFIDESFVVCAKCARHFKYVEGMLAKDLLKFINDLKIDEKQGDLF